MKEKQSKNSHAMMGRVLVPPLGMYIIRYISLTYSIRTKAPAQVEGKFRLTTSTWPPDWLEPEG